VTLDIAEGKLFLLFDLRETQRAIKEVLRLRFELGLGQREINVDKRNKNKKYATYLEEEIAAMLQVANGTESCWRS
jgi:hypothetical protein